MAVLRQLALLLWKNYTVQVGVRRCACLLYTSDAADDRFLV